MNKILYLVTIMALLFTGTFISLPVSAQYPSEWIDKDVEIFNDFFDNFPVRSESIEKNLYNRLDKFEKNWCDSIGFDAALYWWIMPGGTITINSKIVTYHGKIATAKTSIDKDYIKRLSAVFERNKSIKENFSKLFQLHINQNSGNDSVYLYTYFNYPVLHEFRNRVAESLGKQKDVDLSECESEYDLLMSPTEKDYFIPDFNRSYFNTTAQDSPVWATKKLMKENRFDCLLNIIRGYSLSGRMYAVSAILQLASYGRYKLSTGDKELIKKVLNLNLVLMDGTTDLSFPIKYNQCIDNELLKLLE